jgi:hypothetical protein
VPPPPLKTLFPVLFQSRVSLPFVQVTTIWESGQFPPDVGVKRSSAVPLALNVTVPSNGAVHEFAEQLNSVMMSLNSQ